MTGLADAGANVAGIAAALRRVDPSAVDAEQWAAFYAAFAELRTETGRINTAMRSRRNASQAERAEGRDGKTYPTNPLSTKDRRKLARHVHALRHDGLSVRQVAAALGDRHGLKRSVGWVAAVLRDFPCDRCSGPTVRGAEQ